MIKERRKKKKLVKRGIALTMAITLVLGAGVIGIAQSIASVANQETLEGRINEMQTKVSSISTTVKEAGDKAGAATDAANAVANKTRTVVEEDMTTANEAVTATTDALNEVNAILGDLDTLRTDAYNAAVTAAQAVIDTEQSERDALAADPTADLTTADAELQAAKDAKSAIETANGVGDEQVDTVDGMVTTVNGLVDPATTSKTDAEEAQGIIKAALDALNPPAGGTGTTDDSNKEDKTDDTDKTDGTTPTGEESANSLDAAGYPEQKIEVFEIAAQSITVSQTTAPTVDGEGYDVTLEATSTSVDVVSDTAADTVLVIDESSSVNDVELAAMKQAAITFVSNMDDKDSVMLVTVSNTVAGYTDENGAYYKVPKGDAGLVEFINQIGTSRVDTTSTDIVGALATAHSLVKDSATANIVVLSDGGVNDTAEIEKTLSKSSINVYTVSYDEALTAGSANEAFMKRIATEEINAMASTDEKAVSVILNAIEVDTTTTQAVAITDADITEVLTKDFIISEDSIVDELTWNDVTINPAGADGEAGWTATFTVEAVEGVSGEVALNEATSAVTFMGMDGEMKSVALPINTIDIGSSVAGISLLDGFDLGQSSAPVNDLTNDDLSYVEVAKNTTVQTDTDSEDEFTDSREYQIDLQAWSNKGEPEPTSVIMVLDSSGSVGNQMNNMERAAKDFADVVLSANDSNEIAVIDFDYMADVISGGTGSNISYSAGGFYPLAYRGDADMYSELTKNTRNWSKMSYTGGGFVSGEGALASLKTNIDKMNANGSTRLDLGLWEATKLFDDATNKENIQIIIFTDGAPTLVDYTTNELKIVDANVINEISEQKEWASDNGANITYSTIGFGGDLGKDYVYLPEGVTINGESRVSGKEFLSSDIFKPGDYYAVPGDEEALKDAFAFLSASIGNPQAVATDKIVDQIDTRFTMDLEDMRHLVNQFYEKNGGTNNTQDADYPVNGETKTWTASNDGTLIIAKDDEGSVTLTWAGKASEIGTPEEKWDYDIQIEAKEDFLGGNIIPTNINGASGSGIYELNGTDSTPDMDFPLPYVNVHAEVPDAKGCQTVFVEDATDLDDFVQKFIEGTGVEISVEDMKTALNNSSSINYSYKDTNDTLGQITITGITKSTNSGTAVDVSLAEIGDELQKAENENDEIVYTVKLQYDAIAADDRGKSNTIDTPIDGTFLGTTPTYQAEEGGKPVTSTGTYTVDVIAGTIDISKSVAEFNNTSQAGDAIFQFKVTEILEDDKEGDVWYRSIRMGEPGNENETLDHAKIISGLPSGTYKVEELSALRYEFVSVVGNNPEAETYLVKDYSVNGNQIVFTIDSDDNFKFMMSTEEGYDAYQCEEVVARKNANVLFTNVKDDKIAETDTDIVANEFVYKNGAWTLVDGATVDGDKVGNYFGGQGPSNGDSKNNN